jgi:hypothetical protein
VKILCLVSNNLGHLDFGGNGYLRVAGCLARRGHRVQWVSTGGTADRLRSLGQTVFDFSGLRPIILQRDSRLEEVNLGAVADNLSALRQLLQSSKPDVCLIDRNLSTAAMLTGSLYIPYASVGTPGGYWGRDSDGVIRLDSPDPRYVELGRRISHLVPGISNGMDSFWQSSPYLNIVFVGRSYYPMAGDSSVTSFVNLFGPSVAPGPRRRLAVAFGNTGDSHLLLNFLTEIRQGQWFPAEDIDLLIGGRTGLIEEIPAGKYTVHHWVDYDDYFPRYRAIAFFGGIGTLWHAIDKQVPMLVVPGGAGDQRLNAERVVGLGLGCAWRANGDNGQSVSESLSEVLTADYSAAFATFRDPGNYSDTLESLAVRLENLGL